MARPPLEIDDYKILEMRSEGKSLIQMSEKFDVSTATLSRRIAHLRQSQGLITKYKEFHNLRISELTARVLDDLETDLPNMSPDQKIKLFGMLQRANEKYEEKGDNKITGLLGLLTAIDEEGENQKACLNPTPGPRI